MKNKINWGVLAPGRIAHKFASDLKLVDSANLLAVGSRDIIRSREFADKFDIERAYGNYKELVKDPDIDVIYIASPHVYHFEHTLLCLSHGKNVLCEKPICMNSEQLNQMINISRQNKLFLMEAFWTRFIPSYLKCKELIKDGMIGDIKYIQADFGFVAPDNPKHRLNNKSLGGGSLLDIGIYPVFLSLDNLGIPDDISAKALFSDANTDISCSIIFSYKNLGALVNLNSSLTTNTPTEAVICGSKGKIHLLSQWHAPTSVEYFSKNDNCLYTFKENGYGYQYEIIEVNNCLFNNKKESELFSLRDSTNLHLVLDEIRNIIGLKYN